MPIFVRKKKQNQSGHAEQDSGISQADSPSEKVQITLDAKEETGQSLGFAGQCGLIGHGQVALAHHMEIHRVEASHVKNPAQESIDLKFAGEHTGDRARKHSGKKSRHGGYPRRLPLHNEHR